ncbi:AraC family transcriptional regulator [Acetivibrio sp. MSJd-27]|mgnify:CR=1 FL=1|uniref:AraC family transcriptional regulator n=1 Tax=Acetivibrio sp. MSJd-27 TaxID=2841523 RepID=UPI001C11C6D9|nr:AraC family transcriptional regulator [Acetivibrio sp. MSJd-27]MBU5449819.1 AraC family transcriptional regulator [Acetivibrio sp. MSJd-27]
MQAPKENNVKQGSYPMQVYLQGTGDYRFHSEPHWHEYMEMIYVVKGRAQAAIGGERFELSQNDIIFVRSKAIHYTDDLMPGETLCFVVCFYPEMIKSTYCSSMEVQYVNQFLGCFNNGREYRISRGTGAENELETILKRMYEVYKAGLIGYELDVKGYFYQMVSAMLRNGYISVNQNPAEKDYSKPFNKVLEYIDNHYMEDLDLTLLSNKMDFSYHYFSKLFKRIVGKSYKQYLDYVRVTAAERFILDEDMNISEAANSVGIKDITCFYRIYKRVRGYSPSDFKRSVKKMKKENENESFSDSQRQRSAPDTDSGSVL